jgi:BON domain-containing protein
MKDTIKRISLTLALVVLAVPMFGKSHAPRDLRDAVRHELVMLPYYNLFDDLEFTVDNNGGVVLMGDVTRPVLKSDAGNVVKKISGVTSVTNNIRVLPLSPFDDRIRVATYRSIANFGGMYRYFLGTDPSIHIIVDNGHVTLKGYVNTEADKNLATIRANGVPGVFSVSNQLLVGEKG